jgi:hypothetical protein
MKKIFAFLLVLCICISFGFKPAAPLASYYYNGGSGTQIVVTFDGSQLHIAPNPYYQPLRVDWYTPNGIYSEAVYGSTFYPYSNYNFVISGYTHSTEPPPNCPSCPPVTSTSVSYYNYY